MTREDIIRMAREAGIVFDDKAFTFYERFAQLVAAAKDAEWKEIVKGQLRCIEALNDIIGGEDSTTTGNILSYSRWEMRLEDAVAAEREACLKICEEQASTNYWEGADVCAETIRARGQQ